MANEEEDEPMGPDINPRRAAMEAYGARPDVHDLLSRFMTDLLCTQPENALEFMVAWASKEQANPAPAAGAPPPAKK
ncbi:hypothetical protein KC19_VG222000 [Ceratodon purpureus]|uniref:Uncharacterized protein n=1 Tax=Ceratodon purpureus TaxID=3225 RepID=A0A8T0HSZ7_CERPU|nr:hypothetical protein KC19_VG222000 [Ceratodon purpureus]KAG0573924.1 hypothetical protein KC19_VG222000 [Ceratodon purpureus]KAG0573925.1 hypothetical protein KC19_VG222000 [Ceratodon purpureus]KAG0573926.1 hypothetical protein KC19_VG222000 [Ceratodon purpureus]KAG0573927.1 hypothetical protein KC19_VG222000 [Ceratodon purpureus]